MTDDTGAGDLPPRLPHVILEAKPGTSEAKFLQDVNWMQELVARYHALKDHFAELHTATGPSDHKKALTILALVQFFAGDMPSASIALVLDLLSSQEVQRYNELVRGMIAAAVAVLRSAGMENLQIERWLDEKIKARPTLDFEASNAMRWFFDCNSGKAPVPSGTLETFLSLRPDPSYSPAEAEAKEWAVSLLDSVVAMKAGPLTRTSRRRG